VVLDADRSLHHHSGSAGVCVYLVRPDGYIGYRSQPAGDQKLWEYIDRLLIARGQGGGPGSATEAIRYPRDVG
jgi:hypothetical protein